MPLITNCNGGFDIWTVTAAPANSSVVGSISWRVDSGAVGLYLNFDGATGWQQIGPTVAATGALTWLLTDNLAAALTIGSTGATNMLVFVTTNGSETLDFNVATMDFTTQAMTFSFIDNTAAAAIFGAAGATNMITLVTTNSSEAVAVAALLTTTDNVASGTARRVGGRAAVDPSESATVANVEAVFATGAYTIPANTLRANSFVKFYALVRVSAVSGGPTAQLRLRVNGLAGTVIFDTTARTVADEDLLILEGFLCCRAAGAGGTMTGFLRYWFGAADADADAAATEVSIDLAGTTAGTWTVAVDTTAANALSLTGVTDAAGTTLQCELFYVEMIG